MKIRSFDVFDTIIGRRCGTPLRMFEEVGRTAAYLGFVQARIDAEKAASTREVYSLSDIYDEFAQQQGVSKITRDRLEYAELLVETRNAFLIPENYSRVQDGDILVSDMYLSEAQIRRMLSAAGFKKNVTLYVTNRGKWTNKIWNKLKVEHSIVLHLGDNERSDVIAPRQHGIQAEHFKGADLSSMERGWLQLPEELVYHIRYGRLACPYEKGSAEAYFWTMQCAVNFPLLYASCQLLRDFIKSGGNERVLFATRDCRTMRQLFQARYPSVAAYDFWSSRAALAKGSEGYVKYVNEHYTSNAVLVEIDATVNSLLTCLPKLADHLHSLFVVAHLDQLAHSPKDLSALRFKAVHPQSLSPEWAYWVLECLNKDSTCRVTDIVDGKPVYDADYRDGDMFDDYPFDERLIKPCHQAMGCLLKGLPIIELEQPVEIVKAALTLMSGQWRRFYQIFSQKDNPELPGQEPHKEQHETEQHKTETSQTPTTVAGDPAASA